MYKVTWNLLKIPFCHILFLISLNSRFNGKILMWKLLPALIFGHSLVEKETKKCAAHWQIIEM
jgi:hypothetical protein